MSVCMTYIYVITEEYTYKVYAYSCSQSSLIVATSELFFIAPPSPFFLLHSICSTVQVAIQWKSSDDYQKPRTFEVECFKSAVPPPPSPVLDVRLSDLEFSEQEIEIRFLVQWSPPATPNGQITHYLACLGGRKLDQFEENPDSVEDGNDTTCQQIETVSPIHLVILYFTEESSHNCYMQEEESFTWITRTPRPDCLYFLVSKHISLLCSR